MKQKEETAIVLEFLPNGYSTDTRPSHRKTAIAQALGKTRFTLLELVPKKDVFLNIGQEVYIGDGKRDEIHHILGKLTYDKLTSTAKTNLEYVLDELIDENEERFVAFFNNAQPMSLRMHQLELLPGLGKKHMHAILEAREEKEFESFEDIKKRVKLMPDPKAVIKKRILNELEGLEKHRIFTD
ncbi:DUF655 domain-containing protein [Candidatus Woesearchaeota archaeon]|jgi:putative nucleotide binding protein|nr:MAG: DUF655 domain-containing protein [Candidatus Woesearchaeota archaeon]